MPVWRYRRPVDDALRLRSRLRHFPAPDFVDTGKFPATDAFMAAMRLIISAAIGLSEVNTGLTSVFSIDV